MSLILMPLFQDAKMTATAQILLSAPTSCGMELKMENLMPTDLLATTKNLEFAHLNNISAL
jgi:hypothetical protein